MLAVAGLMLALFLVALDQTVVGTALPKIVAELNGFERYAWVTTAYLLASTSMIPVIGKLGDIYGRKWFIVGGIVVFLIGSPLSGAAWGMTELILFRGIQGLGAGMIFSNVFTSVADIFPDPANRARYQGVFSGVFALSSVVGPTLGGWITDNLDWRWIFYINVPLGIFSLFALPFVLEASIAGTPAELPKTKEQRSHYSGSSELMSKYFVVGVGGTRRGVTAMMATPTSLGVHYAGGRA